MDKTITKNKVGRPILTPKEKELSKKRRTEKNRINKRKSRANKKLKELFNEKLKAIEELFNIRKACNNFKLKSLTKNDIKNIKYRLGIADHFSKYNLNYYMVGTFNPDTSLNLNHLSMFKDYKKIPKKITYEQLESYTTKYIDYLTQKGFISKALFTIESGEFGNLHVNIAMEVVNSQILDVKNLLSNSWLLGNSKTEPVVDLHSLIMYMTKELDMFSKKESDKKKLDYWNFKNIKQSENPYPATEMVRVKIKHFIRIFTPQLRCIEGGNQIMVTHKIRYLRVA